AAPDQNRVRSGLQREELFTVLFQQVMTDTSEYVDLALPATTFLEQYDVAKGYGAYHLQLVQPVIAPVGEARPNDEVFRELGRRLGQVNDDEDLGEAGALMEVTAKFPPNLTPALLDGGSAPAPDGNRPVQ